MARMKTYQRLLYVGLGGTGLNIGMQLEQALRTELCGSNGRALIDELEIQGLEPYQLPRCIQFVYFDFDEADRSAARQASSALASPSAAEANSQVIANISPPQDSYAKVAESLRIDGPAAVRRWLPDADDEPQVAPLSRGAGQLPTVGRAALFEGFRAGMGPSSVTSALSEAFARLSGAGGDLAAVSGNAALSGYDVFVGFSVAGGTGCGLYYDILRLLGQVVHDEGFDDGNSVSIYPLVVMPSAFETEHRDDRRSHMLNGGPALKDLFELVDTYYTRPGGLEPIQYPGGIAAGAAVPTKTAFLFSRPSSLTKEDLHRSIVAFILSAVGTTVQTDQGQVFHPLMQTLINDTRFIGSPAPDGVGLHPAATALAAELRVPLEEIVDILAQHLLANATRAMTKPEPVEEVENRELFNVFGTASRLGVLSGIQPPVKLPDVTKRGANEITEQLKLREARAEKAIRDLRASLHTQLGRLAAEYDYEAGVKALTQNVDLFRSNRVVLGDPKFQDDVVREGFRGAIARFAQQPPPNPREFTEIPPALSRMKDGLKGARKLGPTDKAVTAAIARQDEWYQWRVVTEYHRVWGGHQEVWEPRMRQMVERLRDVTAGFDEQAAAEPESFVARCQRLYRRRTGVVYFMPDGGSRDDLESWYSTTVLPRLCEVLNLPEGSDEGRIVRTIMFGRWRDAYESTRHGSSVAPRDFVLRMIRKRLTEDVLATGDESSLLPRIETLLREAARRAEDGQATVPARLLEIFQRSLQQLLPADFRPKGRMHGETGRLKVDVFYPSAQPDGNVESYLGRTALGPIDTTGVTFHAVTGVDFLSVLLRRDSLSAMAVDEYRSVMSLRREALTDYQPSDYVAWRQRLAHDRNWLVLRQPERVRVLAAFLTALYDGSIKVIEGTDAQPERLHIFQVDEGAGRPIDLPLVVDTAGSSRWCDLVSAYERYVLSGDQHALSRCEALLRRRSPARKDRGPSTLYLTFRAIAARELKVATKLWFEMCDRAQVDEQSSDPPKPMAYEFWAELLPQADRFNQRDPDWLALSLNLAGIDVDDDGELAAPARTGG
ncbi:MAG: tubulin-like doman-containing protein [Baekduia sp.]